MSSSYPYGYYPVPQPPAPSRRGGLHVRSLAGGFAAGVVAAAVVAGGLAASHSAATGSVTGTGALAQVPSLPGGYTPGNVPGLLPSGSGSSQGRTTPANATQEAGVVTVVSVLKYQNAESAGTGMILTSDGEVLTNNHVVDGATRIVVTVESTGRSYRAQVVGTAPTNDVAVLKLSNASGLQTADLASSSSGLQVGSAVTGVGNAGGTGRLTAAAGKVTALGQTITASDESGQQSERLHGLIETNADIISGDSGGPLYDSSGHIVGMDTAANASGGRDAAYAIPVEHAMSVVRKIESGIETSSIHIGLPGFLGIGPVDNSRGVQVQNVLPGGPASQAGIRQGAVISSIDGTAIRSSTQLHDLLSAKGPGTSVTVTWHDRAGAAHTATITLATGPAD